MRLFKSSSGQSSVEFVVVIPVVLIVALIAYNALSFLAVCAKFDRVARSSCVVHISGGGIGVADSIRSDLEAAFQDDRLTFHVDIEEHQQTSGALLSLAQGSHVGVCRVEMELRPRIDSLSDISTGIPMSISHETQIVVDPYRSSVIS